jgi:hypothetical protein
MIPIDRPALQARNNLLLMFLLLCVLDVTLVLIAKDRWATGRILITVIVMYFVIQGQKWAKWFLVTICSLLTVLLIAMVLALASKLSTTLIVGSIVLAVLNTIITLYLVTSKDLNHYFAYKRQASRS